MDPRTFTTLELPKLIELLAGQVSTPLGRQRALQISPLTDDRAINLALDRTTECANYISIGGGFGLGEVADPEPALREMRIAGTSLEAKQIIEIQTLLSVGVSLSEQFADPETRGRYPRLAAICSSIPDLRRALSSIRGKILPNGEVDDNASPELRRIRREINERRTRIYRNLESLMRERAQTAIQDDVVTVRNGRFVIPVKTDARGQVPGVMHGLSSSGQTTYVEPLGIIDQNNDLVRLREQEEIEIAQILFSITETLRAYLPGIESSVEAIAEIDFAQAKARLSREFNCVRPEVTAATHLLLEDARHLLLEQTLRSSNGRIVPISLEMDAEHQTLVVSGPNAGGKTVVTKTVGLIALMAQMGLHVPARSARLPVFRQVLADIGDQQSIAANLSTFTGHMKNIAEMARLVSPAARGEGRALPALILIDEVGTGTDPDEGAALGIAIVDYFRRAGATTIATTHYNPLKVWASRAEDVLNASVEFDERTLRPTYRLIVGVAGASSGVEIARRMEVPEEVLAEAGSHLSIEHSQASEYLKQLKSLVDEQAAQRLALEEERQATAEKYARLDLEFARRENDRRAQFERELSTVVREFTEESARLIDSIKDRATAARLKREADARTADLRRSAGVRIKKKAAAAPVTGSALDPSSSPSSVRENAGANLSSELPPEGRSDVGPELLEAAGEIRERDRVRIKSLGQVGTVEKISGDEYTVLAGSLRLRARRGELQLLKSPAESPGASSSGKSGRRASALSESAMQARASSGVHTELASSDGFTSEINLIGSTVDEATDRVDKYLDAAFLSGAESVRIIHGHGKGALRKAVAELLRGHPHVESFGPAPANEGGAGATIAQLKK